MTHTHVTAPTLFVEANRIRFAYRRFGQKTGVPLLFMQHFRGGLDHWDPAITDGFAKDRPVILFDNAGVASSSGETPRTVEAMADHAADFVNALGLSQLDLLGFSLGGYVAQVFTFRHPNVVRRLMLVRVLHRRCPHSQRPSLTGGKCEENGSPSSSPSRGQFESFVVNRTPWPSIFSAEPAGHQGVLSSINAGGTCVNETVNSPRQVSCAPSGVSFKWARQLAWVFRIPCLGSDLV